MKKAMAILLALSLAAGALAACGPGGTSSTDQSGYPGTSGADSLVYNLVYEPQNMNPITSADGGSITVLSLTLEGLVKTGPDGDPVPAIAESWEYDEATLTYTFHLRSDAVWSSGEPVTAHDFVYSWRQLCAPDSISNVSYDGYLLKNGLAYASGTMPAEALGVAAPDDHTLVVQLENPCGYFLQKLTGTQFGPLPQAFVEACGDSFATSAETLPCNSSYKIAEWIHEDHITLERNATYYDAENVGLETLTFVMIGDTNAALNAFQAGEIDILPQISAEQVTAMQAQGVTVGSYNNNGARYILYNCENEYLANANIRRALSQAIDRSVLAQQVLGDGSEAAYSYCPPSFPGVEGSFIAEAGAPFLTDDPSQAAAYLEQGLAELGKTKEDMQAAGLSIIVDENSIYQKVITYMLEQWKSQLGIEIKAEVMPKKSRIERVYSTHDYAMAYATWTPDYNDANCNLLLFETTNDNNGGNYTNPRYDELIALAAAEADGDTRIAYLLECERILMDDAAIAPLYFECTNYILSDKIQSYAPGPWRQALRYVQVQG